MLECAGLDERSAPLFEKMRMLLIHCALSGRRRGEFVRGIGDSERLLLLPFESEGFNSGDCEPVSRDFMFRDSVLLAGADCETAD